MFATTADGAKVDYVIEGQGEARIVLLHSLGLDRRFWTPVVALLAPHAQVLTLDLRGHGRSDMAGAPYTAEQFAGDVAAVMDDAGWDKAVIAGCSLGGCVALAFAVHHAERCQALGLLDTTAWYGEDAGQTWPARGQKVMAEGMASLTQIQLSRWFSEGFRQARPDVAAASAGVFEATAPEAFAAGCGLLAALDLRAALASITVPTRVAVGQEDLATPLAMSQALAAGIPGARLDVIAGAHLTPLESPDAVAAILRDLIAAA
jgi:3-oxoadipate enol-lactonase